MAMAADGRKAKEIAHSANVAPDQLSRWKHGRAYPEVTSIEALVRTLRIDGHWLLTGDGPMAYEESDAGLRLELIGKLAGGELGPDVVADLSRRAVTVRDAEHADAVVDRARNALTEVREARAEGQKKKRA